MHARSRRIALAISAIVLAHAAVGADEVVLRRAVSLEEIAGRARVRTVYAPRIDVPAPCEDGSLHCTETVRFEQVVEVELSLESRADRGGETVSSEESAGRVLLAASLDEDGYDRFRAALARTLAALAAEAYRTPLAGLDHASPPFDARTLARTDGSAWVCLDRPDGREIWRHQREETPAEDGTVAQITLGSTGYSDPDLVDPVCGQMAAATAGSWPDEVRTRTVPTLLEVTEVRVEDVVDLPGEGWRDELAGLPDGAWLVRRERPGVRSARSIGGDDADGSAVATWTKDGVEHEARVVPARLPARLADRPLVAQRWTVERSARRLGARPADSVLDGFDVLVGWFPVPSASEESAEGKRPEPGDGPFDVRFDREAMLDAVAARLLDTGNLTADAVDRAVTMRPSGLESDGWMFVVCSPDGSASWGLPPTEARTAAIDPLPLCGALDSRLP